MENNNKKKITIVLILIISILFLGSVSYAYFTTKINKIGEGSINIETAELASATMKYGGTISSNGALPGYKTIRTIHVKGTGSENSKPIKVYMLLKPDVRDFDNHIKYHIYETEGEIPVDPNSICESSNIKSENNHYYEAMECNTYSLGEKITSGIFVKTIEVSEEISIEYNTNKTYYILIEYVNDEEKPQNEEQGKNFTIRLDVVTEIKPSAVEYITKLASISNEIVDDETPAHNLRYIGNNPNNYVLFNNEIWRIIGVMNDVKDELGIIEPRLKLMRNETLGPYSWDNKGENGSNNWINSALKKVLNEGAYYNRTSGNCPNGSNESTTACDFSESGLTEESKSLISNVEWKLGGIEDEKYKDNNTGLIRQIYDYERGTTVYNGYETKWLGKVGLMYLSDYGYATMGGSNSSRDSCLNISMWNWYYNAGECYSNNWVFKKAKNNHLWIISPNASNDYKTFYIHFDGYIHEYQATYLREFQPVVYLNTNIRINSGNGTMDNPFILQN